VVGCVPADISEGIGLSDPVAAVVDEASAVVTELVSGLVDSLVGATPAGDRGAGD